MAGTSVTMGESKMEFEKTTPPPPPPYTEQADNQQPQSFHPEPPIGEVFSVSRVVYTHQVPPPQFPGVGHTSGVTVVQAPIRFGTKSQRVTCLNCGVSTDTRIKAKPNGMTHAIALILCCFVCWPCAWVPYACDSCQSIHHYCPNCNTYLGEHNF